MLEAELQKLWVEGEGETTYNVENRQEAKIIWKILERQDLGQCCMYTGGPSEFSSSRLVPLLSALRGRRDGLVWAHGYICKRTFLLDWFTMCKDSES